MGSDRSLEARSGVGSGRTRAALRNAVVRRVVGAFAAVTVAEWVLGTSVAVHAYPVGGALLVGLVGFRFVPASIAGLATAQFAATHRRERVLTATALTRALASALAAASLAVGLPFAAVLMLVWLDSVAGSAYRPAQAALLPAISRTPSDLTAATALTSNAKSSGQLLGALAGGVLVASMPVAGAVLCASALYLASAFATSGIRTAHRPAAPSKVGLRERLQGMRVGATAVRGDPEASHIVLYACLRSLTRGLWMALGVVAALRLLGLGQAGFGILMAAASAGALAAILLSARLIGRRRLAPWLAAGLLLCGVPIAAIGGLAAGAPAVALMIVWGLGMSLSDVAGQALLNRVVPAVSIARVTGLMESGKLLFEGGGSLLAPLLVAMLGIRMGLIATGAGVTVLVAAGRRSFARIDDRAAGRVEIVELAGNVPFFRRLRVDSLEGVVAQLQRVTFPAGHEVITQGECNDAHWYLVEHGRLEVLVDGFLVNECKRGDGFGELALMRSAPRSATIRASTDVVLLSLDRRAFLAAVGGPDAELGDEADVAAPLPSDHASLLGRTALLSGVGAQALDELARDALVYEFATGSPIVTEGAIEDSYHVLVAGSAAVIVASERRRVLRPGDGFGEIAVLHRVPRTASVIAEEPSMVLTVPGDALRAVAQARGGLLGELAAAAASPGATQSAAQAPE